LAPSSMVLMIARLFGIGLFVLLAGAGCTARHRVCASPELMRASGQVEVGAKTDDAQVLETDILRSFAERSRTANSSSTANRPAKVLALSGGGMYGAYTTGILAGWTAAGTRPCFDVVTGVS